MASFRPSSSLKTFLQVFVMDLCTAGSQSVWFPCRRPAYRNCNISAGPRSVPAQPVAFCIKSNESNAPHPPPPTPQKSCMVSCRAFMWVLFRHGENKFCRHQTNLYTRRWQHLEMSSSTKENFPYARPRATQKFFPYICHTHHLQHPQNISLCWWIAVVVGSYVLCGLSILYW